MGQRDRAIVYVATYFHFQSFRHFYSAPSSPLLLRGVPDYSTNTVSEFHAEAHRQLQVKDLPNVRTWRLERESNPRPSGRKSSSQPRRHHVPQFSLGSLGSKPVSVHSLSVVYSLYGGVICSPPPTHPFRSSSRLT